MCELRSTFIVTFTIEAAILEDSIRGRAQMKVKCLVSTGMNECSLHPICSVEGPLGVGDPISISNAPHGKFSFRTYRIPINRKR